MIGRLFSKFFRFLNITRLIIINFIFFAILLVIIGVIAAIPNNENTITVPKNAALVLDLSGQIVEQKQQTAPFDAFFAEAMEQPQENPEVLLSDIVSALNAAKNDDNIQMLTLKLGKLHNSGLSTLQDVAKAISDFKTSGKPVIALGDNYTQAQYYIASYADEIWLNPKGWLLLDGFSSYGLFFKSALDKLDVNQHIFRVGTYKAAVEPFIRDDMSPEAKEANLSWLNDLWLQYKTEVATQRQFNINNFDEKLDVLLDKLSSANGNIAEYALNNNWVDSLKTREEMRLALIDLVGKNKKNNVNGINFKDYLKTQKPSIEFENPHTDKVAIIVAKGNILNGHQKPGNIGGSSTAKLLRKARENNNVKAVVLRVDSPGGSAFASEIIRQEVELLKAAGKPVIASMGSYAASGGYWISASADKIIASPSTITGSIGIFGLFMTFEDTLANLGVYTDGVGTTEISGFGLTRPLNDKLGRLIQLNINRGYQDFISIVAENRNMTLEQVDKIAQGRVWSGVKAKELGLVDALGNIDTAIQAAADMAGLEYYETQLFEKEPSKFDKFLQELVKETTSLSQHSLGEEVLTDLTANSVFNNTSLTSLIKQLTAEAKQLEQLNDPQGAYAFCLPCKIN